MGGWAFPTTADIGMRCFAGSQGALFEQAVSTMQGILISDSGMRTAAELSPSSGELSISSPIEENTLERLLVLLLEEILFRAEVEDEWITDLSIELCEVQGDLRVDAEYEHVDGQQVEREIEIKAVTLHGLRVAHLGVDDSILSDWSEVPRITGPGWYCDVIFDI